VTTRGKPDTTPNKKLMAARLRVFSPTGSGQPMSRQELAEAVNAWQWEHEEVKDHLDENDIGSYERGEYRWPRGRRRAGIRAVTGVQTDAELGFYRNRRSPSAVGTVTAEPPDHDGSPVGMRNDGMGSRTRPDLEPSGDAVEALQQAHHRPGTSTWPPEWADQVRRGVSNPAGDAKSDFLGVLRLQLETAKMLDGRYGAAAALATANGVIDVVESVTPDVSEGMRDDVLALGAEAAEFVGWLFRDLADIKQARYWYDRAMEYAQMCGDFSMQGFVLLRKSQMAYESRSGHHVRRLAQAAIEGPWQLPPRFYAEALLQSARGDLMVGQAVDLEEVVNRAREAAGGDDLTLREASCWIEANNPERAVQLYEDGLTAGGISVRDVGYYRSRQAIALAQVEEPDLAAEGAQVALSASVGTGSLRTERTVRETRTMLTPWESRESVVALDNALNRVQSPNQRQLGSLVPAIPDSADSDTLDLHRRQTRVVRPRS
jgi:hypothetical protein